MPAHPRILRWVGSLSYASPALDALARRIPNIGFVVITAVPTTAIAESWGEEGAPTP